MTARVLRPARASVLPGDECGVQVGFRGGAMRIRPSVSAVETHQPGCVYPAAVKDVPECGSAGRVGPQG